MLGLVAYSLDPHFPYEMTGERAIRHFMMIGNHVLTIWTVGIEVQFYAVFAIIWLLLGGPERKDWLLGAVAFGGVLALNVSHDDVGLINLVDAGAFFLIGLLVDIGHRHFSGEAKKALGKALPLFLTLYVLLMFVHADRWAYRSIAFEVVTAGCVLTACLSKGPAQRFLASRPMVFLGEISFGTYLLHRPTIYVLERLLGLGHHTVATTLLTLPCTIAAAYVAYVLIEKPARSCIRNIGRAEPVAA